MFISLLCCKEFLPRHMHRWSLHSKNTVLNIDYSSIRTMFGAGTICLFKLQQIHFVALIMILIICMKRKNCLQHGQMETKFAMI